ncbi:type II CAAX endopeptidase family protein [Natrialba sp. INN-245]|uniref:CPBP family intramembrane glutamic endopeptidase n=1 Tax=Natrialba sp. INN-245 TaxID=2690967 RepID=UPI001311C824|nr:type II CAAX endopeptidase family protein [Natrialba sp. INN-245]MWV38609.1 CPBP family intramembrane metalloprotease [Natrialba sp. INN-245]
MSTLPAPSDQPPSRSGIVAALGSIGFVVVPFAVIFAIAFSFMLALVVAFGVTGDLEGFESFLTGEFEIIALVAEPVLFGAVTAGLAALSFSQGWIRKRALGIELPTPKELLVGAGSVVALLGIAILVGFVTEQLGVPSSEHSLLTEDRAVGYYVLLAVVSILLIGPVEELLFRGLIQNYVRPAFGSAGAVVWTSILFAIIHLPVYLTMGFSSAVASLVAIFALSLVMGGVYEQYRNLVLVMGIHGVYNAVVFLSQAPL